MLRPIGTLLALALLLVGCATENEVPEPVSGPDPSTPTQGPRLVGLGGLALAAPRDWGSQVHDGCTRPPDLTFVFRGFTKDRCGTPIRRTRSFVVLEELDRGDSILLAMGRGRPIGPERVRQTGLSCHARSCDQTVAVPGLGVLLQFHLRGPDAEESLRDLRSSLQLVPDGQVAVPPIPFGTGDDAALALLAEAGLEGRIPEVDWPHYVTASSPPAGTVVPAGSTIDLAIGDG